MKVLPYKHIQPFSPEGFFVSVNNFPYLDQVYLTIISDICRKVTNIGST